MKSQFLQAGTLLCLFGTSLRPLAAQQAAPTPVPLNASAVFSRYQWALDQLAQGNATEARVILEESARRYGETSETSLLLAYLLKREGRIAEARQRLQRFSTSAPLAAEFINSVANIGDFGDSGNPTPATNTETTIRVDTNSLHRLTQSDARLEKLEKTMAQMVNAEREKAGLRPLTYSEDLADVARAHSAEMRDKKYFAHESPVENLREPLDRYKAGLSHTPRLVAENIYRVWGARHRISEQDIRTGHEALMKSSGHRANILLPSAQRIGIGIVANDNGDIWLTQLFDRP